MKICKEEIFGPVQVYRWSKIAGSTPASQVIQKFSTVDEVIERANASSYGLAAAVFTKDIGNAIYLSNSLRAGTVWVNCYDVLEAQVPP